MRSDTLTLKAARFALIGALSGGVFSVVTVLLTSGAGFDPKLSAAVGYAVSIPLNFIGNRAFSFRSGNKWLGDLLRYATLHLSNVLLTTFAMGAVVDTLHLHYAVGIVAAVVLIPAINFSVMNLWVFSSRVRRPAAARPTDIN